jgi:hypothetical protein
MEGAAAEQSEPLTLLRRSRRVLGDIDLDETMIPPSGGMYMALLLCPCIERRCPSSRQRDHYVKAGSESSQSEQATNKRREQVRKAQRYFCRLTKTPWQF